MTSIYIKNRSELGVDAFKNLVNSLIEGEEETFLKFSVHLRNSLTNITAVANLALLSGIYFCTLQTGNSKLVQRWALTQ